MVLAVLHWQLPLLIQQCRDSWLCPWKSVQWDRSRIVGCPYQGFQMFWPQLTAKCKFYIVTWYTRSCNLWLKPKFHKTYCACYTLKIPVYSVLFYSILLISSFISKIVLSETHEIDFTNCEWVFHHGLKNAALAFKQREAPIDMSSRKVFNAGSWFQRFWKSKCRPLN